MGTRSLLQEFPPEIPNEIYRYLLSTTHTKITVDPGNYGLYSSITQRLQPGHRYDIHINILCMNRTIFHEAIAIFRQNTFVRISTRSAGARSFYGSLGFMPFSSGRKAQDVRDIAMSITYEDDLDNNGNELCNIFAVDDLRLLCRSLRSLRAIDNIQNMAFKVVIHGSSEVRGQALDHSDTLALSRSHQFLEPLTELYDMTRFTISGSVNGDYKHKIIDQIARPAPRQEESLEMVMELWTKGDDALKCHQFAVALEEYKAALLHLETRTWDMNIIETGDFANAPRYKVYHIVAICLIECLAISFPLMRMFDKAHYWAPFALGSIVRNKGTISHPLSQYAELSHLMATTSRALGKRRRALGELGRALHFDPDNALVKVDLVGLCVSFALKKEVARELEAGKVESNVCLILRTSYKDPKETWRWMGQGGYERAFNDCVLCLVFSSFQTPQSRAGKPFLRHLRVWQRSFALSSVRNRKIPGRVRWGKEWRRGREKSLRCQRRWMTGMRDVGR